MGLVREPAGRTVRREATVISTIQNSSCIMHVLDTFIRPFRKQNSVMPVAFLRHCGEMKAAYFSQSQLVARSDTVKIVNSFKLSTTKGSDVVIAPPVFARLTVLSSNGSP